MLPLYLCALLATAPVELRAGPTEPEDTVTLDASGLRVPTRREAGIYLFGRLGLPSHSLRALLLRSTDGGAHWIEVLPEVEHSEVLFVDFAGCEGRALVGWSTEGPGEVTLYASADCGATWKRRSKLPKSVWSEWPESMAWKSARQGTVWMLDTNGENPLPRVLTTRDGGRTWKAEKKPPQAQPPAQPTTEPWVIHSDEQGTRLEYQEQGAPVQLRTFLPRYWRREGNMLVPAR